MQAQLAEAAFVRAPPPPAAAPAPDAFPAPPSRPAPPSSSAAPAPPVPPQAPRAHYFHYGQKSVKARIDPEVPLDEVLRQLCASSQLQVSEPATLFALREKDSGTLVTQDNMRAMLATATVFQLVSSPLLEAVEMVDKLSTSEPSALKLATFSLRTLIKERAFLAEFVARGGVDALQKVIRRSAGNTLAYALLSLQNLLELEDNGWMGLDRGFVARIVEIIATEPLINISRPATAILRRLASQPVLSPTSPSASVSSAQSGFAAVFGAILAQPNFLRIVVERLSSGDVAVTNLSLGLLNTLLRGSTELGDLRLADELDSLDAWKVVGKLLDGSKGADLATLLSLQSNLLSSVRLALTTPIDEQHYPYFDQVWIASRLDDMDESNRWRRLGFLTESPQYEFVQTGLLGLKALRRFAEDSQNEFAQTLQDQAARPESRRCPVSTVSNVVLHLLAEHFGLTPAHATPAPATTPSPYLFRFYELHALVVQFFLRIWAEAGATPADLERIAGLARSQIASVLGAGGEKTWFAVRREFLTAEYRQVRERQLREMEIEDDLLSKAPVRNLRGRLYLESYEFVRSQRISCLHEGAWLLASPAGSSTSSTAGSARRPSGQGKGSSWRFYRLAANRKALHWCEAMERRAVRAGLDDLPEKIDLASITDIVASGAASGPHRPHRVSQVGGLARTGSSLSQSHGGNAPERGSVTRLSFLSKESLSGSGGASPAPPPTLSFTLVGAEGPLVELTAPSAATYSEWVDGLSLLRPEGSISTRQTAEYIQALTDIGVKVKLLDLSGEKVEIPAKVEVSKVPASTAFYYADSL
ncbi:hypothetical protein JCM10450v2_005614 [Rhodotorula kratochvilovae]